MTIFTSLAALLALAGCAAPDGSLGKIGPDYQEFQSSGAVRTQQMHSSIQRGGF